MIGGVPGGDTRGMDARATRGRRGEQAAAAYLTRRGWRVVARRWRGGGGEIDLVARRGRTLALCEVKARAEEDALREPIGPGQRARMVRAARAYVACRPDIEEREVRLDLITVRLGRLRRRVRHHPGALEEGG